MTNTIDKQQKLNIFNTNDWRWRTHQTRNNMQQNTDKSSFMTSGRKQRTNDTEEWTDRSTTERLWLSHDRGMVKSSIVSDSSKHVAKPIYQHTPLSEKLKPLLLTSVCGSI